MRPHDDVLRAKAEQASAYARAQFEIKVLSMQRYDSLDAENTRILRCVRIALEQLKLSDTVRAVDELLRALSGGFET